MFIIAVPAIKQCIYVPKWGTLGRAQDRASAASRNDVWVKEPSAPNRFY